MNAFVFAGGYGTRLRPYTLTVPKPMLPVFGRPMVAYVLAGLARAGVRHATVNAAWLADSFDVLPAMGPELGLEIAISKQKKPLQHGGDLAVATAFWDLLSPDEVFLAANGDTLYDLDGPALAAAATSVTAAAPLLFLGDRRDDGGLRVRAGRLVGIGDVDYVASTDADGPEERWDDAGLKFFHATVRALLPPPGTEMSLHGREGLVGRIIAAGGTVHVAPAPIRARAEIGTVAAYEAHPNDAALHALTRRLMGEDEG